jgi:hypothetical protein
MQDQWTMQLTTAPLPKKFKQTLMVAFGAIVILFGAAVITPPSADAANGPRWVYVGREPFVINDGARISIPTYVNTNSIEGDRYDTFTITFQARFGGKQGINRVNVGVIVDCNEGSAYADQFYIYYSKGSSDYDRTDGGDISPRVQNRALSYCR